MLILTVLQGPDRGKVFGRPDNEPQQIGRSSESLPLTDQTISRRHAELTPDTGHWYVNDLHSANGTTVNGRPVTSRQMLHPGDQIKTGETLFVFGMDERGARQHGVRVARSGEIDAHVQRTAESNEQSMIIDVPDPRLQLRVIYELTELIGTIVEKNDLLHRVMSLIFDNFSADRGFVLLQDDPQDRPDPVVVKRRNEPPEGQQAPITVSRTIVQYVLRKGKAILSSNAMTDERFADGDSVQDYGIHSALCVPIKYKDHTFGVIYIDSLIANYTFAEEQLKLLTAIGIHTGLALANAKLYHERMEQERLAVVGQTVASLSHSIRNILQGMRGGADVVELGIRKNSLKVASGGWDIVARNLDRISKLTLNMLAFSKQRKPDKELVGIRGLLEDIASLTQNQFDQKNTLLIVDVDDAVPPIPLDPDGVHQAIVNLVNNALDAIEPETGVVTVRAEFDDDKQAIAIQVSDNGHGIDRTRQKKLFRPFESTKGQRGTGLGLVVAQKIVKEHGGVIYVESEIGVGTTFTMLLPVKDEAINMADTLSPDDSTSPGGEDVYDEDDTDAM